MRYISLIFCLAFIFVSCGNPKKELEKRIIAMNNQDSLANTAGLFHYADLLNQYITKYPKDKKSENYLFQLAQSCNGLNKHTEAIDYLSLYLNQYPEGEKKADALFIKAFIYENNLNQKDSAIQLYETFLEKYPQHALAESVKLSLQNIDTPLEELVKGFMEKLDADSSAKNQAD
jgi:tetratricopeptide (TPR) repeat protein